MSYYMGDFYMSKGGWRGDPGFWGSVLGFAKKGIGLIPGVGPIASGAISMVSGASGGGGAGAAMQRVGSMIIKHPVVSGAAAAGALGAATLGIEEMRGMGAMAGGQAPRGYHLCKSMRPGVKHPHPCKRGPWVRNRRMNVCNPRALRRSIRRCHGFAKLAMKTIHIVHPKKKGRFGGFRTRRKK